MFLYKKKVHHMLLLIGVVYILWHWMLPIAFLVLPLCAYYMRNNGYWQYRNVPFLQPAPVLGNLKDLLQVKVSPGQFLANIYSAAHGQNFVGFFIFDRPALLIRDPELIKNILVKNFDHFPARHTKTHYSVDPVGARNLFTVRGQRWKFVRKNMTSAFTSGKMKTMFHNISKCSADLGDYLKEFSADTGKAIKIRDLMARSATDVISICMFGINSNTLRNPDAEFRKYGKKVFGFTKYRAIEILGLFFAPALAKLGRFQFFQKETTAFFQKVFTEAIEYRLKSDVTRNDLLDAIIKLKTATTGQMDEAEKYEDQIKSNTAELDFSEEDLVAQGAIFFSAGFETTSITLSFSLYELATNPDIQIKLRREIKAVREANGGQLSYNAVNQMKYLDMVVSETLRKYPPLPYLDRLCLKDFHIPGTDVVIEKGTPVYIPVLAIQRDPLYYPEPMCFNPERFSEELKRVRSTYTYLPFGQGPHSCIGLRFGLLSTKVTLVHILSRFQVEPSTETPTPVQLSPYALFLSSVGGIPLAFKHIPDDFP